MLEYRFSESAYVAECVWQRQLGILRVDEAEFAEVLQHDVEENNNYTYEELRDNLLDVRNWLGLQGDNPFVTFEPYPGTESH